MTLLVAGGDGQVARALVAQAGPGVVALGRDRLDIADPPTIEAALAAHRPELIVNAAGYTAVDRAEAEPAQAFRTNGDGPGHLAAAAARHGARFVHLGSDFVFDGRQGGAYAPDDPPAPLGVYGASKAAGEAAVRAAVPAALIVRTAWVYAAHGANFMLTMLRLMAERAEVRVVCDQIGTPTHARSLARAILALDKARASGIHHFTDAGVASRYDFAVAIQEEALALGLLARRVPVIPVRTADYPTPAPRPACAVLDTAATYALLGAPAAHWRVELRLALAELGGRHG